MAEILLMFLAKNMSDDVRKRIEESEMKLSGSDMAQIEEIIAIVKRYLLDRTPKIVKRIEFFDIKERKGEDIRAFFKRIEWMSEYAEIGSMTTDEMSCALLVRGCTDSELKEKFLEMGDAISMERIEEVAVRYEAVKKMLWYLQ